MVKQISKKVIPLVLALFFMTSSLCFGLEDKDALLEFVKDHIVAESKNSNIVGVEDPESGIMRWFEVYGILNTIKEEEDIVTVIVDVTELGNESNDYLILYEIKNKKGKFKVVSVRLGPTHDRSVTIRQ